MLSSFIPSTERIITIEDAKELQLRQGHVLCLEYRPPNTEGTGEVTIRDLLRNSLRMRPDRIIIGECRSGEALDMLQAMNTGHEGSLTTVHANSPRDALVPGGDDDLDGGFDLPIRAVREQMAAALDLIVHLARMRDGSRRVTHVTEVGRMEGEMVLLQDIFTFDYRMGSDENGRPLGHLKATGLRPHITQRLADRGVKDRPVRVRGGPHVARPCRSGRAALRRKPTGSRSAEVKVREGSLAVAAPHLGHFFTSVEHRIQPLGLLAIGLAVAAVLCTSSYGGPIGTAGPLWQVSSNRTG